MLTCENMGKGESTFLRTSHSIEGESLAEFIADDEEYRLGVLQLLESLKKERNRLRSIRVTKYSRNEKRW